MNKGKRGRKEGREVMQCDLEGGEEEEEGYHPDRDRVCTNVRRKKKVTGSFDGQMVPPFPPSLPSLSLYGPGT